MKKEKSGVCPGCSKHCPQNAPRCKYGRAYFAKLEKKCKEKQPREYKWESYTKKGDLAWQLLLLCRNMKKALRAHKLTEEEIFAPLTPEEKAELALLVQKLDFCNDIPSQNVSNEQIHGI